MVSCMTMAVDVGSAVCRCGISRRSGFAKPPNGPIGGGPLIAREILDDKSNHGLDDGFYGVVWCRASNFLVAWGVYVVREMMDKFDHQERTKLESAHHTRPKLLV